MTMTLPHSEESAILESMTVLHKIDNAIDTSYHVVFYRLGSIELYGVTTRHDNIL